MSDIITTTVRSSKPLVVEINNLIVDLLLDSIVSVLVDGINLIDDRGGIFFVRTESFYMGKSDGLRAPKANTS